jgi:hypothetical protein
VRFIILKLRMQAISHTRRFYVPAIHTSRRNELSAMRNEPAAPGLCTSLRYRPRYPLSLATVAIGSGYSAVICPVRPLRSVFYSHRIARIWYTSIMLIIGNHAGNAYTGRSIDRIVDTAIVLLADNSI